MLVVSYVILVLLNVDVVTIKCDILPLRDTIPTKKKKKKFVDIVEFSVSKKVCYLSILK